VNRSTPSIGETLLSCSHTSVMAKTSRCGPGEFDVSVEAIAEEDELGLFVAALEALADENSDRIASFSLLVETASFVGAAIPSVEPLGRILDCRVV